jgi:outer membrane receptor protein involved in Fe transport
MMKRNQLLAILSAMLFLFMPAAPSLAQQAATATLEGLITDPAGAVVPNATVTARNTQTGLTRTIQTDASGVYRLAALPPGSYDLNVTAPNFAEAKRTGITLTVGQKLNLDIALSLTASAETVNVTAEAPVLETTRTNVAVSVGELQVRSLPVNGRNFLDFVTLTAGVVRDPRQGDLSFGGQRGTFNTLQIDGVDNNNNFFGQALGRTGSGRAPYQFSQDAVQEFQVNTNSFSAEFGRAAGGAINVITKSGTNEFHGVGFEFFRDRILNANSLRRDTGLENFTRRPSLIPVGFRYDAASRTVIGRADKPAYHFNQFGGNFGGPVKKDRAFFFFNYDGQRNTRPITMALGTQAPTDAASQAGLARVLPFIQNYTLGFNQDVYLGKFDWQADEANRLSVRYNGQRFKGRNLENSGAQSAQEHSGNSNVTTNQFTVQLNTTFTPRLLNEFRTQFAYDKEPGTANSDNAEGNILQNGQTVVVIGRNSFSPRATNEDKYQFVDNVSYFTGKHSLKGGLDFLIEKIENFFPGNFGGRYFFQATNGFAEFANHFDPANAGYRRVTRYQQSFAGEGTTGALTRPDFNEYGFFVQDDWRVAKNFSLNLGLRYDLQLMKRPSTFNPSPALAAAGLSTSQFHNDFNNWAPRLGFAWNPTERLVVRGGYGLFFGRTPAIALGTAHSNNGINVIGITLNNAVLPFNYPNRFPSLAAIQALGGQAAVADIFIFDRNYQQPYTQQGSFGVEYGLARDISVGASYLYVKGTNLSRTRDLNLGVPVQSSLFVLATPDSVVNPASDPRLSFLRHPGATAPTRPIAGFGRISQFEGSADSVYNALALTVKKRFARHFQIEASYTWSKVIDNTPDQTSVVVGGGDDAKQTQYSFSLADDRGLGAADVPHRFVASGVWDLSYFGGLKGAANQIVNGWELAGILQIAANQPISELVGADLNNNGNNRTDRSPFIGRNTLREGRFQSVDLRVTKSFFLREDRIRLQFIGEMFNAFNRLNIGGYQGNRYSVVGLNTANAALRPNFNFLFPTSQVTDGQRIGQLALKLIF